MGSALAGGDAPWRSVARRSSSLPRAPPTRISGSPEIELRRLYASGTACTMRGGGQVACSDGRGGLASWGGARAEDRGWCPPRTTRRFRSSRMWWQVLGSNKRRPSRRLTDRLALPLPMVAQLPKLPATTEPSASSPTASSESCTAASKPIPSTTKPPPGPTTVPQLLDIQNMGCLPQIGSPSAARHRLR